MFARGIRTHIIINMVLVLFAAMFLINIVLIFMAQRLRMAEISTDADIISAAISEFHLEIIDFKRSKETLNPDLKALLENKGVVTIALMDREGNFSDIFTEEEGQPPLRPLISLMKKSTLEKRTFNSYEGSGWGVLWRYHQFFLKAHPISIGGNDSYVCGIVISLKSLHKELRQIQKISFLYIIINIIILGGFSTYRIFRIYFRPVQRLVRRAEEYEDHSEFFFNVRKEDDELGKLSSALNNMLNRISKDKLKLRSTVENLEVANQQLTTAQNEIIRAEKLASIGRLSSGIAHEIGNPIGIVLGYLDLLKQEDLENEVRKDYIVRAEDEINRINTIIRQLLDYSRPSPGKMTIVSVHDIICNIIDVVKQQPIMAGVHLEKHLEADVDCILADPEQLRQVLLNMLLNSADAICSIGENHSGTIKIETLLESVHEERIPEDVNRLKIIIKDNGPGMAKTDMEKIFDPFYTTKEPGKGTGLGLYVSLMIIEKFGGTITADSWPEQGTTMTIAIPSQGKKNA